jgi:hypothetical protein
MPSGLELEIQAAHKALDRAGIPRESRQGKVLNLRTRILLLDFERRALVSKLKKKKRL